MDELVNQWLDIDINPSTRQEVLQLQQDGNYEALKSKLSKRIAFGTAGLRSSMEAGFAHMNDVTILQASQGLIAYLESKGSSSIVIGYDHRFNSQRFAEITASVAVLKGFSVYYLGSTEVLSKESLQLCQKGRPFRESESGDRQYVHTPMVPFAIDLFHASAGVMVTASHNPANDNGYKVYYGNGCQIIPPVDHEIASSIDENLTPWSSEVWNVVENFDTGTRKQLLKPVKTQVTEAYITAINSKLIRQRALNFNFVYTPIHGVGLEIFDQVLHKFNSKKMVVVEDQKTPDPSFPTVGFPNPEEKGALDSAIKTADQNNLNLVVANDPDADRFSVAIRTNGEWRQLTGNEIGFLFAQYVIEETPKDQLPNTYLINSTVSSQILSTMAEKEGFQFQDTLTGFKWIGNKAIDMKKLGFNVPFAYEEAIGYMFDLVNDKDGIAAAVMWLQLYSKWAVTQHGDDPSLIIAKLQHGYEKYGFSKEHNGYYKVKQLSKTADIFCLIRKSYEPNAYPSTLGDFQVTYWRDLTVGYETGTKDNKPGLPTDSSSQMITAAMKLGNDGIVRFTCRGSGTEPKLKVYIEGKSDKEEVAVELARKCWDCLRDSWFQPEVNELEEVVNM